MCYTKTMPAKNTVKIYLQNAYYHLYNRGVEKRNIFINNHDYKTFLSLLKTYLSPTSKKSSPKELARNLFRLLRRVYP